VEPSRVRERLRLVAGDVRDVEPAAEPFLQHVRAGEGLLQRDLLVQKHADQERQRILGEQRVGVWIGREIQGHALILADWGQAGAAGPPHTQETHNEWRATGPLAPGKRILGGDD
jgi:hypothetical protein